jgi:hypothetical protein
MEASWVRALTPEWQSPWSSAGWRPVSVGAFIGIRPLFFGYAALLAGVLYVAGRRWRTVDLVPLCLMALWLALGLWHLRAVSDAVLITAEAERALQTCPGEATFAWIYKVKALRALGRYQEAVDAAVKIAPELLGLR